MKVYTLIIALFSLFIFSCTNKAKEVPVLDPLREPDPGLVKSAPAIKECYEFVQKKDTISLSLIRNNNDVEGHLNFSNFEKDSSHGPVSGTFVGDTLKLEYSFASEGLESKREIYFLKNGNSLLMGTGEMEEKKDIQSYKNTKAIKYDETILLEKIACVK